MRFGFLFLLQLTSVVYISPVTLNVSITKLSLVLGSELKRKNKIFLRSGRLLSGAWLQRIPVIVIE